MRVGDGCAWAWPEVAAAKVNDARRVLRRGPVVDLQVLVGHVYEQITPMDFEAILASPITFHPMATDARTGKAVDLAPYLTDRASLQAALRASACLPLLAGPPVELGGGRYVDGGLAAAVPWPTAVEQGASHVVVLRTRREDQLPTGSRLERVVLSSYFRRHAPGAGRSHRMRHHRYREADAVDAVGAAALQIRPPLGSPDVPRLSGDLAAIDRALDIGREAGLDALRAAVTPL